MSNVFGFSTASAASGGDFMPIVKYDSRAGRMFRIDRSDTGQGFQNEPVDITTEFRALADFENVETGWIDFVAGSPPNFVLVSLRDLEEKRVQLPPKPSERHKNGIRFVVKLAKNCGGDKPIREIAGNARVFLTGIEAIYTAYKAEKANNPGKLPVIALERTIGVKSGSGERQSTNYQPVFKIVGWSPRGDLQPAPKAQASNGSGAHLPSPTPPATGSTRVEAPKAAQAQAEDDFG